MNDLEAEHRLHAERLQPGKFRDPDITATGAERARVALERLETLWINTGTLCNITCRNCYIESSPTNDRLVYMTADEVSAFLDEIDTLKLDTREIGFTGGEPFMNPDILAMLGDVLSRGYEALVLTNAMQPMMRPRLRDGLLALKDKAEKLTLRISLDHYSEVLHDDERGKGAFKRSIQGTNWLSENGFKLAVAGRTCWGETVEQAREGYRALFAEHGWQIDADDPAALVLFPEMDETLDIAEITTDCWRILDKSPSSVMCASSRMVVKRKGEDTPTVLPCTLLPYDKGFGMGATLGESLKADGGAFENGKVKLNHPHCARFCVLGGASCSG